MKRFYKIVIKGSASVYQIIDTKLLTSNEEVNYSLVINMARESQLLDTEEALYNILDVEELSAYDFHKSTRFKLVDISNKERLRHRELLWRLSPLDLNKENISKIFDIVRELNETLKSLN